MQQGPRGGAPALRPRQAPVCAQHPHAELGALWVTLLVPQVWVCPPSSQTRAPRLSLARLHGVVGVWGGGGEMDAMGLAAGSSPRPGFREPPAGTGGSWPWQGALGRGSRAYATRVTTPQVLSPAGISFYRGRGGWRKRVPRATRVTRAPCPLSQPSAVSAALAWTYATI